MNTKCKVSIRAINFLSTRVILSSRLDSEGWIAARIIGSTTRPRVYILPLYSTYRGLLKPPFAAEQYACPPRHRVITLNHVPPQRGRE